MAITLGKAVLYLNGDASQLESSLGRTEGLVKGALGKLGGFLGGAFQFAVGGLMQRGIEGIAGAVGDLARGMIQGNAEFEQYETRFGTLLGSAAAAKQRMAELAEFGAKTPFDLPQVVKADTILQGFGFHSEEAAKKFGFSGAQIRTIAGDVASGTGASFEEISLLLGRFASGATGEALMRMAELGIGTREQLGKMGLEFKKSGELVSPLPQAMTAVLTLMQGKYGGLMAAQSSTFEGMKSNLRDWLGNAQRVIGKPLFETLKAKLGDLLTLLGSPAVMAELERFANALAGGLSRGIGFLERVGRPIGNLIAWLQRGMTVGEAFSLAFGTRIGGPIRMLERWLAPGVRAIGNLIAWLRQGMTIGQAFAFTFGPGISGPMTGAFNTIRSIIGGVISFIRGIIDQASGSNALWGDTWSRIQAIVMTVLPALRSIITSIFAAVGTFLAAHGTEIQTFLVRAWQTISQIVNVAVQIIQATIVPAFQAVAAFLQSHGVEIQTFLGNTWTFIQTTIDTVLNVILGLLRTFLALFRGDWSGAWELLKGTLQVAWDGIRTIFDTALAQLNLLTGGKLDELREWFVTKFAAIREFLNGFNLRNMGVAIVQGLIDGVRSMAQKLIDAAVGVVNNAIAAAKALLGIQSPSAVFAAIGQDSVAGFVAGIMGAAGQAQAAVAQALSFDMPQLAFAGAEAGPGPAGEATRGPRVFVGGDSYSIVINDRAAAALTMAMIDERRRNRLNQFMGA